MVLASAPAPRIGQLPDWQDRYGKAGLTIVGVHTPEFLWEKFYDRIASATRRLGVRYPVVQDNDYAIWRRLDTRGRAPVVCRGP